MTPVSVPVWALGSFLPVVVWIDEATRIPTRQVSVPVWALGSFLHGAEWVGKGRGLEPERFSARVGSGVFSTRRGPHRRAARPRGFSARVGSGVFSTV